MKKITKTILNSISKIDINTTKNYKAQRLFHDVVGMNILKKYPFFDTRILVQDHTVGIRVFFPKEKTDKMILYFHGGGWVVGSAENYTKECGNLANTLHQIVVSVDYRLAPEYPFPAGLVDCYYATRYFYSEDSFLDVNPSNITIMGDSAGGNLAAVVSYLASDTKEFKIHRQILLYPLTYYDHSVTSPFASVHENGKDWILTAKRIEEYLQLYAYDEAELETPYISVYNAKKLKNQPKTLLITAELDPLRDEGEAFGEKLKTFGNDVTMYCMKEAIHGFFSTPIMTKNIQKTYQLIDEFLKER